MKNSKRDEVARKSRLQSAMRDANKCSHVICKGSSAAKDKGRSNKYSKHRNIIAPEVHVVYVYEPNIIKTDPENFLSLVQRLTGKFTHESTRSKKQTNPRGPTSEVIPAEVGTVCSNDQRPIMENKSIKCPTEGHSGLCKGFSEMDMVFHGLHEIPLVRNTSPFYNMYEQTGGYL